MDEARRKGIDVDVRSLARDLGVPAIPVVARTGEGLHALLTAVDGVVTGEIATKPRRAGGHAGVQCGDRELMTQIEAAAPGVPNAAGWRFACSTATPASSRRSAPASCATLVARQQRPDDRFSSRSRCRGRSKQRALASVSRAGASDRRRQELRRGAASSTAASATKR